jgi:hypothetical protein
VLPDSYIDPVNKEYGGRSFLTSMLSLFREYLQFVSGFIL